MTNKWPPYYTDSYTHSFTAQVIEKMEDHTIILDHTYFYPASGGQPHDTGIINGVAVMDVTIREADGAVLHWMEKKVMGNEATAVINWDRRFDHMQQHTGQHILSRAFIQTAVSETAVPETVSFHLSDDTVTIDLNVPQLSSRQIEEAERLANKIVFENRLITTRFVSLEEAKRLPLRKIPPARNGRLRLVDIESFDLNACGGTHVERTGSVGLIKIIKLERQARQVRIEFRCGYRALIDYKEKNTVLSDLSTALSTNYVDVPVSLEKLQTENKKNGRLLKKLKSDLLSYEADEMVKNGRLLGRCTLITHVFNDKDGNDLRTLGKQLCQHKNVIALLGSTAGDKTQLLFSRHVDADGDMKQLLRVAFQEIRGGGGGSCTFAQGGGEMAGKTAVKKALARAEEELRADKLP